MTTVQKGYRNLLSGKMSYDEIDFAERLGDDDIDIDIDFETGQNDEDYILEDVDSDIGHEEAVIGNDDAMIDDENVSYPMDDVDALQEEHIEMEDADLSDVPATELNNPGIDNTLEENAPLHLVGFDEASETVIVELDSLEEPSRYIEPEKVLGEQAFTEEKLIPVERTVNANSTLSPPTSPIQSDPGANIGDDQRFPPSDVAHSPSFGTGSANEDSNDLVAPSEIAAATEQMQGEQEVKSSEDDSIMLSAKKVIVIYQDVEYTLCSSSESDDPDTYFLKDGNLVNGPLANLLAGLREVIHEDLGSEDELCLVAEDLGIEISETCISVHDVNFASVIHLHERLLRNDGVETPGPLYVTLGTKPDFAKRLANLAVGAAAGKGMSDIVSWDEESEDFEENVTEDEQLQVTDQNSGPLNASIGNEKNSHVGEGAVEEQLPENVDSEQSTESEADDAAVPEDHNGGQMPQDHNRPATSDNISPVVDGSDQGLTQETHPTAQAAEASNYFKDGLDEDGDLIDYEDEEYGQSRENSASANIDSSGKQNGNSPDFILRCSGLASCMCPSCMKHPLIYDEEKNSVLDQHLLSPAPEEKEQHIQPDSNSRQSPSIHSDQYHGENLNQEADNEDGDFAGYEEHEEYEVDNLLAHEQTGEDDVQDGEEFQVSYECLQEENDSGRNGNLVEDDVATNAQGFFNSPELDYQSEAAETGDGESEEIDYDKTGQESAIIGQTDHLGASAVETEGSRSLGAGRYDQDDDEISYEDADILDSNESERTLIADESAPDFNLDETEQAHNDEINYDTDDQQELKHSAEQEATSEASHISNGYSGKRQRADVEDATDRASKQSKRARS